MEKYKLQYLNTNYDVLAIRRLNGCMPGDFCVYAIREETDEKNHDTIKGQRHVYTEPMTLEEAKMFVSLFGPCSNAENMLKKCKGLSLEDSLKDECRDIKFE